MYEQILTYITAIAPSLATVVTAIVMFVRIITATREMCSGLRKDTEKKLTEAMDAQYAHMATLSEAVRKVTDSNEIQQIKTQYTECMKELEVLTRQNAELLAKLEQRGY